jgi:hypothetical protein
MASQNNGAPAQKYGTPDTAQRTMNNTASTKTIAACTRNAGCGKPAARGDRSGRAGRSAVSAASSSVYLVA